MRPRMKIWPKLCQGKWRIEKKAAARSDAGILGIFFKRVRRMKPRKKISSRIGAMKLMIRRLVRALCLMSSKSSKSTCSPKPGRGRLNFSLRPTMRPARRM